MLRVTVAHSEDPDTSAAAGELVAQALEDWGRSQPRAGLLFAAIGLDHGHLVARLREAFPTLALLGCTTDGEAASPLGFREGSAVLVLLGGEEVRLTVGVGRNLARDPVAAAAAAVRAARAGTTAEPRLLLAFPDALSSDGASLVRALQREVGPGCAVLGGTAGDQLRFERTYQFFGDEVLTDAVPVLLFSGPIAVSHGIGSGWRPIGKRLPVTRAEGNVVHEIAWMPALDVYRSYLGARQTPMGECALAVYEPGAAGFYLRAPFSFDEETGSVTFAGGVPSEAEVQLTDMDRREVLAAARSSVEEALARFPGRKLEAALFFSCAGRKTVLGTQSEGEYAALRALLPPDVPIAGFYAYGEIAPLEPAGTSRFHNETFVTLLVGR